MEKMKTNSVNFLWRSAGAAAVISFGLTAVAIGICIAGAPIGHVEKFFQQSMVERGEVGTAKSTPLHQAENIFEDDRVYTGETSRLHLRFRDRTYIEIGPRSSFSAERIHRGAGAVEESVFRFYYGVARITAINAQDWVQFYVKSADLIFRVKGPTDFFLSKTKAGGELSVSVRKGKIEMSSAVRGIKAEVGEGKVRTVRYDGTFRDSAPLTDAWLSRLKESTKILLESDPGSVETSSMTKGILK